MKRVCFLALLFALQVSIAHFLIFQFIPMSYSWPEAQTYCRTHHTDLATIGNQETLDHVRSLIPQDCNDAWIGLSREGPTAAWVWSDKSPTAFLPWGYDQPNNWNQNQYCVELKLGEYYSLGSLNNFGSGNNPGTFNDLACDTYLSFICYDGEGYKELAEDSYLQDAHSCVTDMVMFLCALGVLGIVVLKTVRLLLNSGQSLNRSQTTSNLQLKIEQLVQEKELKNYSKVSWRTQTDGNVFQRTQEIPPRPQGQP
ncbi:hypothetical protein DNTS_021717 [Danionella cerebrum]|uniref:C-type lectin domain-containing protein n=1 Tax=Danionella cerebrum TaxID=2873325 RepID=A0A553NJ70_9TELE|nr:hypothetical protein DNTS_021717 [Danionella translucida]